MDTNLPSGLKEIKIVDLREINGKFELLIERNSTSAICPDCLVPSHSIKDHEYYQIIDKPIKSMPLQLSIKKRRFFCYNPSCSRHSFQETIPGLPQNSSFTQNFKDFLVELYQDMDYPTIKKHLSRNYKLAMPLSTIHYLLKDIPMKESQLLPPSLQSPIYIGIDEFSYAKGHTYAVALINIDKRKIIDMVAGGKTTAAAKAVLNSINPTTVKACCIDMWEPYKVACRQKLPNAFIVVDRFHVVKHINKCIEQVRKRASLLLGQADEVYLYQNRFILLKGQERLSESQRAKLLSLLSINEDLAKTYDFKERLRTLYSTHEPEKVYPKLLDWVKDAQKSKIPELVQIADSFASEWFTEIFNYWHHRISNGITEGKINKIRVIQRKAYHYRNFHSLRYQVLKSEL